MTKTTLALAALLLSLPVVAGAQNGQRHPVDRIVAVVGSEPILLSEVREVYAQQLARGMPEPPDSAAQMALARQILNGLIDTELMVQRARDMAIEAPEDRIRAQVDQQLAAIRRQFPNEDDLRRALTDAGYVSIEEYRRSIMEFGRREALQQGLMSQLRMEKKLPAVSVTDEEISRAFDQYKPQLEQRPATVTFRQIVIPPQATAESKAAAKRKADSLLVVLRADGDFEQIARRESMDTASAQLGGDLGWARRGTMVPAFEYWLFTLQPGQLSPVFETVYGYHILRVDRVQPAERKSRHVLIRPTIDSVARAQTRALADSVADLWRNGASFDSLVAQFHDEYELRGSPTPFVRDSLPAEYQQAFAQHPAGTIVPPFPIGPPTAPKFVIAQLQTVTETGEYSEAEYRQLIREQIAQEKAVRKWLDQLRAETYVSIRM